MNWDSPTERLELIERIGIDAYNKAINEYQTHNPIRHIWTQFGGLWTAGATGKAFSTRQEAVDYLKGQQK